MSSIFRGWEDSPTMQKSFGKFVKMSKSLNTFKDGSLYTGQSYVKRAGIITMFAIAIIYITMWLHNKKLDKLLPGTKKKFFAYDIMLREEFSPKELDDLYRLISTDDLLTRYIHETFKGKASPEMEKYITRRLSIEQRQKLKNVSLKIHNHLSKKNESLNETEKLFESGIISKYMSPILQLIFDQLKDTIFTTILFIGLSKIWPDKNKRLEYAIKKYDPKYVDKFMKLRMLYSKNFGPKDIKDLNNALMGDIEFVNYLQRYKRSNNLKERDELTQIMEEHASKILPYKLKIKLYQTILDGIKLKIFDKGTINTFSIFKPQGDQLAGNMILTGKSIKG